ncbi:uncharacterized protein BX664DRAFT_326654 [Halteromyces radiatus]|uniref:uncharacterized protein n=1 Tax=Halteromyces radiatus TaxID=101107 RepID=UPI002220549F|nr:uncharacterized protein BX664DRAFT_326654 [Halteromyces radiatus]KAI8097546.1 hypothetical protein BX664DRAFT_326654 [Halteromyces radiatus]
MSDSVVKESTTTPRLILRSYRPSDHEQVDFIFYSTYFALVPEGVKQKLRSPLFWICWITVYGYLLAIIPILLSGMSVPSWTGRVLQVFMTIAWGLVSFAGMFVMTDRLDVIDRIEQVRQNDLRDPEVYYMNVVKEEKIVIEEEEDTSKDQQKKKRVTFDKDTKPATEIVRTPKPKDQQTKSHFWVLQMDNQICGMVGLAQYKDIQYDQRPPLPPGWIKIGQLLCERYGVTPPSFLQFNPPTNIFAQPHAPHTATLQRLAVKQEFQGCGLASILVNRVMSWAHQQGITQVFAVTNEMQSVAADILRKHHQFTKVKSERKGWLGQTETTWVCHVEQWYDQHAAQADTFAKDTTPTTSSSEASG